MENQGYVGPKRFGGSDSELRIASSRRSREKRQSVVRWYDKFGVAQNHGVPVMGIWAWLNSLEGNALREALDYVALTELLSSDERVHMDRLRLRCDSPLPSSASRKIDLHGWFEVNPGWRECADIEASCTVFILEGGTFKAVFSVDEDVKVAEGQIGMSDDGREPIEVR